MKIELETNVAAFNEQLELQLQSIYVALFEAQDEWGKQVKHAAEENSKGEMKKALLNTYKPGIYSKVRDVDPAFAAIVNNQTDDFLDNWHSDTKQFDNEIVTTIDNTSQHAKFMLGLDGTGTKKMVARNVLEESIKNVSDRDAILLAIIEKAGSL